MKKITVPKIEMTTPEGDFGLRVSRSDLVQVSGEFQFSGGRFPFTLTLIKTKDGKWQPHQIGMEKLSKEIVRIFSAWAETHPRLLQLADRVHQHNIEDELHLLPRANHRSK